MSLHQTQADSGDRTESRQVDYVGLGATVWAETTGVPATNASYTNGPGGDPLAVTDGIGSTETLH